MGFRRLDGTDFEKLYKILDHRGGFYNKAKEFEIVPSRKTSLPWKPIGDFSEVSSGQKRQLEELSTHVVWNEAHLLWSITYDTQVSDKHKQMLRTLGIPKYDRSRGTGQPSSPRTMFRASMAYAKDRKSVLAKGTLPFKVPLRVVNCEEHGKVLSDERDSCPICANVSIVPSGEKLLDVVYYYSVTRNPLGSRAYLWIENTRINDNSWKPGGEGFDVFLKEGLAKCLIT